MDQQGRHIIFFDGDCLICNRFVQILLRIDHKKKFLFSSLQSQLAQTALTTIPKNIDSIVYLSPVGSYIKSEAVLKICKQLGFPYTACYFFQYFTPQVARFTFMITLPKTVIDGLGRINFVPYRPALSDNDSFN